VNTATIKNQLIEKINTLSAEQLQLVANLVSQFEQDFDSEKMTEKEEKAIAKWEFLLKNDKEINNNDPLSNEEIKLIRSVLSSQSKNLPVDLPKDDFFIADDFNAPLPDDIIDLFYS
jgi:CRISPR/Cas system-associated endonuclease Cas3-HD